MNPLKATARILGLIALMLLLAYIFAPMFEGPYTPGAITFRAMVDGKIMDLFNLIGAALH